MGSKRMTTKDRIRMRAQPAMSKMIIPNEELMAERITTRLEWARASFSAFWKETNSSTRPQRYDVVMDGNWWFWNILLAACPGLLVVLYCETIAKPQMIKQALEQGDPLPPKPPTVKESMNQLYNWFQHFWLGRELELELGSELESATTTTTTTLPISVGGDKSNQATKRKSTTSPQPTSSTSTTSTSNSTQQQQQQDQQLQQIQDLKLQLEALEEQVVMGKCKSGTTTTISTTDVNRDGDSDGSPAQSRIRQRIVERQQLRNEQQQQQQRQSSLPSTSSMFPALLESMQLQLNSVLGNIINIGNEEVLTESKKASKEDAESLLSSSTTTSTSTSTSESESKNQPNTNATKAITKASANNNTTTTTTTQGPMENNSNSLSLDPAISTIVSNHHLQAENIPPQIAITDGGPRKSWWKVW